MEIVIQDQYRNTNIEILINGILSIREKHRVAALNALRDDVFNLSTAKGDALDLWGRLLNFSRFIPVDTQEGVDTFKNFSFYDRNFFKLKFFDFNDLVYAKLTDDAYRQILQILYYNRNTYSNIYNASSLASEVFKNDIFVGDSQNMTFVTYYFKEEIPAWLNWVLQKYDILPRPVCVGTRFQSALWKIFNFFTDDANFNSKISAFYNSQFLGSRDPNDASGNIPINPPTNNNNDDDKGGGS